MHILAIETSCDETAIAVIQAHDEQATVRSNVISSQVALHTQYGGVVPALAAREHTKNIGHVFASALREAGITDFKKEVDLIVVTHGPGLGPALLVGLTFAKTLAWLHDKPIVGINHMDGHIHSNWLEPLEPVVDIFPALNVIVSGGHTELVLMRGHGDYEIIGETVDDAIGEAFDKTARLLGLGYPGGPIISKLAEQGNPEAYALPRPMLNSGNFNFSYSGLKTAVLYLLRDLGYKDKEVPENIKRDIAASFQMAAIDVIIAKTEQATQQHDVKALLLSGGVSANKMLRERLKNLATKLDIKNFCPKMIYTTDNAAMIAVAGYFKYIGNKKTDSSWESVVMDANLRLS